MKRLAIITFLLVLLTSTRFALNGHAQAQGAQGARNVIVVFHDDQADVDGLAAEHARL
jgi:hypothetical protein